MNKHLIFGTGLIGSYLGTVMNQIAQSSDNIGMAKVVWYARPSWAEKLTNGVRITDFNQNEIANAKPSVITQLAGLTDEEPIDYVWLTVKCTAVENASKDLCKIVRPHTVIICCQNGLDSHMTVKRAFPNNLVLRVMVPFNVVEQGNGHFHRGSEGTLTIETSAHDRVFRRLLTEPSINNGSDTSILPLAFTEEMTALQWAKLQLNLGNSVNALANIPVKAMLEDRGYRLIIAAMMSELLTVTRQAGIVLPNVAAVGPRVIPWVLRLPNVLFKRVANQMLQIDPHVKTSMWWDLELGRTTEIDFLNQKVVEYGQQLGVACPVNQAIVSTVKAVEQHPENRPTYSADELTNLIKSFRPDVKGNV
ncbi:2-dehydropantoate 2-reductase [Alteromonas sp. ASW11-36]|uniref:2-dehydropantoate 2-reductase n=1 Tax=Alteromonas arenosi TaxID=3055817 RepID=A0ABT7SY16_9ALTE|nr:2-dehydropantoate 2-reductase [Alteromonas sp. ASW11-36]MDM7861087.1 2-dehydropantoate 2-reductase [Alteromonas sp. ASW11-36]